jgi:predicted 2-oxoglutarate/Fe(II)-dependent dioxygenase YbiX
MIDLHNNVIRQLKIVLEHYKPLNYIAEISYFEAINFVKYGPGQFFKTHTDDGDPYRCTVSAVGYPNDDYEGGELKFPIFKLTYKPKAGDLVVFPSAYAYAHSSEPVTNDAVKYSLVIMTDRNNFANRKDSPVLYDPQLLRDNGFKVYGM